MKEIVIKIPNNYDLSNIQNGSIASKVILDAVANGTVLPEGHGDIVDMKTLIDMFWDGSYMEIHKDDLAVIKPLIEADKPKDIETQDIEMQATEFLAEARVCAETEEDIERE